MFRSLVFACALGTLLCLSSSCGSSGQADPARSQRNSPEVAKAVPEKSSVQPTSADVNATAANSNSAAFPDAKIQDPRALRLTKRGPKLPGSDSPPPPPTAIAAPDNSVFTAVLTDVATEIRTFKDHPQLLKVEKKTGTDWSRIKVFLKDGRVIELDGDKISSLGTVSAASILAAAGVSPAVTGRTGQQKRN